MDLLICFFLHFSFYRLENLLRSSSLNFGNCVTPSNEDPIANLPPAWSADAFITFDTTTQQHRPRHLFDDALAFRISVDFGKTRQKKYEFGPSGHFMFGAVTAQLLSLGMHSELGAGCGTMSPSRIATIALAEARSETHEALSCLLQTAGITDSITKCETYINTVLVPALAQKYGPNLPIKRAVIFRGGDSKTLNSLMGRQGVVPCLHRGDSGVGAQAGCCFCTHRLLLENVDVEWLASQTPAIDFGSNPAEEGHALKDFLRALLTGTFQQHSHLYHDDNAAAVPQSERMRAAQEHFDRALDPSKGSWDVCSTFDFEIVAGVHNICASSALALDRALQHPPLARLAEELDASGDGHDMQPPLKRRNSMTSATNEPPTGGPTSTRKATFLPTRPLLCTPTTELWHYVGDSLHQDMRVTCALIANIALAVCDARKRAACTPASSAASTSRAPASARRHKRTLSVDAGTQAVQDLDKLMKGVTEAINRLVKRYAGSACSWNLEWKKYKNGSKSSKVKQYGGFEGGCVERLFTPTAPFGILPITDLIEEIAALVSDIDCGAACRSILDYSRDLISAFARFRQARRACETSTGAAPTPEALRELLESSVEAVYLTLPDTRYSSEHLITYSLHMAIFHTFGWIRDPRFGHNLTIHSQQGVSDQHVVFCRLLFI